MTKRLCANCNHDHDLDTSKCLVCKCKTFEPKYIPLADSAARNEIEGYGRAESPWMPSDKG